MMAHAAVPTLMAPMKSLGLTDIQQAERLDPLNRPSEMVRLRGKNVTIANVARLEV
jgi:hypothetical protein